VVAVAVAESAADEVELEAEVEAEAVEEEQYTSGCIPSSTAWLAYIQDHGHHPGCIKIT
jgi:hypothetical protein